MNDKILSIIIKAQDQASKTIAAVGASVDAASSKMSSMGDSFESAGRKMESTGAGMTRAFTLPVVAVGAASIKMAMDFQQAMTYVRTDAGDTEDNIDQLSQSVLNLAKVSQFSPDELANGLYHLASLGLRGADAMHALATAQNMAAVGGANLEDTSSALGAALVTGIKGVKDYSQAAGTLDAIIGAGNMRMEDLVTALGTGVLTAFKGAGLSLKEFGAAEATLTDNGMDAAASATRLRMTIAMMQAPTGPATDALKRLGMTANQMGLDMQTKGLIPALQDLKKHLLDTYGTTALGKQKIAQALTEMFGGGRSSAAIETLLDQLGRVSSKEKQIGDQSGEFASKVAEQQQTAAAKLKTAWSSVQADLIQLGDRLLPTVAQEMQALVGKIDALTKWWNGLHGWQKKIIEDGVLFLAVAGPMLSIIGKISVGVGALIKVGAGAVGLFGKIFDVGKAGVNLAALTARAAVAAAVWAAQAIRTAAVWTAQFTVIAVKATGTAIIMALKAADAGTAWVINATRASFVWVTTEMPRIVASMTVTAVQASIAAIRTSTAWVISATTSGTAWVITQMPRVIASFVATAAVATFRASITAAAWVLAASRTSIAWVVTTLPRVIAAFVAMAASASLNAARASASWAASAAATTRTFKALAALIATPMFLPAIAIGAAIAALDLVYRAVQKVRGAIADMKAASSAAAGADNSREAFISQIIAEEKSGKISRAKGASIISKLAAGKAVGGPVTAGQPYIVGENEPELFVPNQSGQILNQKQMSRAGIGGGTFNMYGNINLGSADAVDRFFKRLDAQKEMGALGVGI